MHKEKIGHKLKQLRLKQGVLLSSLAERLKMSEYELNTLEVGEKEWTEQQTHLYILALVDFKYLKTN